MKSTRMLAAVSVAVVGVGGAGTALAAKTKPAPTKTTIRAITHGSSYKVNRGVTDTLRWNRDVYQIKSGGMLTLTSSANNEGPHTFTFVKSKKDLPRTTKQFNAAGNCATKLCQTMVAAHQADPSSQAPPKKLVVDVNKTGVDTGYRSGKAGDSWFLNEPGAKPYHVKVSAKKGTTLYLICLIHPWMQAKLQVK